MDRLGRIGVNAAVKRAPPSCLSRPTSLSLVSRIAPFSAAPAVQIFDLTQRATIVTPSVELLIIVIFLVMGVDKVIPVHFPTSW